MLKVFIKYEHKPKKAQSQLNNMIVYVLETFDSDKAVPYATCLDKLRKISGKYNRDITQREYEKCRKDCIVFKRTDSFNESYTMFYNSKEKLKKLIIKLLNNIFNLLAHKGSGFDIYVVFKNLPQ